VLALDGSGGFSRYDEMKNNWSNKWSWLLFGLAIAAGE
jgi:hypothetical protein